MRILVTGGAGFIGSTYVRKLMSGAYPQQSNAQVTVLDKLTYAGNLANLAEVERHPSFRFVHGDINDRPLVDKLMADTDLVVHFAAESHVDRSIEESTAFLTSNVLGTHTLLQSALDKGAGTFVHVSTDEVYGSIETGSWSETEPLLPNSPYSASKASAELMVRSFHRTYGLDTRVTRCSNNYGPYQHPEKLIPRFVTSLLDGGQVPLYGDGSNVRDWLHVDDHCTGIALVIERGSAGEVYNIGGGTELTNRELTGLLLEATDSDWTSVQNVTDRKGHDQRYSVTTDKARTELGYEPRVPFAEGLADTVRWYRDNTAWWRPLTSEPASL